MKIGKKGHEKSRFGIGSLVLTALFAFLFAAGFGGILSTNAMRYLMQIFLYICLGEAWNLLGGFAGMTSLGQQLYIGIAGYSVAVATTLWHIHFLPGILLGMLLSMLVAALLSPALFRMKGMYFAIATWIAAEAARKVTGTAEAAVPEDEILEFPPV